MSLAPPLTSEDARAIEGLHDRWMSDELAGNTTAVLDLCADDVVWLPPGAPPLRGKRQILEWLSGPTVRLESLRLFNLEIRGGSATAWKTCEFESVLRAAGTPGAVTVRGAHLWVLDKGPTGWRIVAVTWTLL